MIEELLKEININKIIRFLFPCAYILVHVLTTNMYDYWQILLYSAAGLFIYPIYKSSYWLLTRKIMSIFNLIPQLNWHKKQIEKFTFSTTKEKKDFHLFQETPPNFV